MLGTSGGRLAAAPRPPSAVWREAALPYLLIAPVTLLMGALVLYPMGRGLLRSLYGGRDLLPRAADFVGIANYRDLARSAEVANSVWITVMYTTGIVGLTLVISMACALLLCDEFKGRGLARAALTVPWGTPLVASALIWYWMYDAQYGLVNFILGRLGIIRASVGWLVSPSWALPAVILVDVWRLFPLGAVVLLSALTAVDRSLYEAARIDGAGGAATFRHVTLPSIRPTFGVLTLLFTIWALKRFATVWILTQGGPAGATDVLAVEIYREAFRNFRMGTASALAMVGIGISAIIAVVYQVLERRGGAAAV
ncbi:MAG TPA: sugar ABC transporter permease [Methylomirabilota bacterium]|nr:sugar ABC transporter permease [Methylomirabilota bacterium]